MHSSFRMISRGSKMLAVAVACALGFGPRLDPAAEVREATFPLATTVATVRTNLSEVKVETTGLARADYLKVISGIVRYFAHFQNADGRIIDPFQRKEVQYSTPCFAWAAARLVATGTDTGLLERAALALDSSLAQLANGTAADGHGDFFTFPAMLAFEQLRERVPGQRRAHWEKLLHEIVPEKAYRDALTDKHKAVHNWNVVALSGEFLRAQDGFTDGAFIERHLDAQWPYFTGNGLYRDPNVPMAYDHFPRHFLAAVLQRGYDGAHRAKLEEMLERAAWTSLLMQSPLGELPTGGRSAQHQWNEAEQCVTYEIWAARKKAAGDVVAAAAFKRATHLALQSILRWVRPSGELWIVKNRFDPASRHGFESYSSHSQYNLLAASMLATASMFADDDIAERACPADAGGFVFELPAFHKVFANAGGLYMEIDTDADPHYNSTGLIRVHRRGVAGLIGPSDSAPGEQTPLAVGVAWQQGGQWQRLASVRAPANERARLSVERTAPGDVRFTVRYPVRGATVRGVAEHYRLTPDEVRVTAEVDGDTPGLRAVFPALTFDGASATRLTISNATAIVSLASDQQRFTIEEPAGARLKLAGPPLRSRNGFLQAVEADVVGRRVTYSLRPTHAP